MDEGTSRVQEAVEASEPFWRSPWFIGFVLAILCCVPYWNSLDGRFQYDDHRLVRFNLALRNTDWKEIIRSEPSRPLSIFSFALNYQIGKTDTRAYHALNIALHFVAVLLFYLFLRRMKPDGWFAIIAAILMAIHPLNTESVSYISGRAIVLCAVFYMLSMLIFDSHLRNPSWRTFVGFIVCFILAGLSKENAAAIPIIALLYVYLLHDKEAFVRGRNLLIVVFALALFAALYRLFGVPDTRVGVPSVVTYWTTELNVWVRYLWLALYPVQLNVDHEVGPLSLTSPWFIGALVLVAGICVLLWKVRRTHPLLTFWGFWFFLNLLPSSIMPVHEYMAEHLTYISLMGFCACISYALMIVLKPFVKPAPLLWVVVLLICGLSIYGTIHRNRVWKDGLTLWTDAVQKSPKKIRPRLNLGEAYIQQKSFEKAINEYSLALTYNPRLKEAFSGIGIAYFRMGANYWAEQYFQKALAQDPNFTDAKIGMGMVMYEDGQCEEALTYLAPLYGERWESSEIVARMADCQVQLGNRTSAIDLLERSVNADTPNGSLYAALMEVYFLEKRNKDALKVYDLYKDRFPPIALTQLRVGTMLRDLGRIDDARAIFIMVSKDPKYGKAARELLKELENSVAIPAPVQKP
jgi:Tfp pilus assembly protein PilF